MKHKHLHLFLLTGFVFIISALTSCMGNKTVDDGSYFENFDNLKQWSADAKVTSEMAHSGSYAAYTDSFNEFSQTFEMEYSFAKSKKYRVIMVSAWCYKTVDNPKAGLVVSLENAEIKSSYASSDLSRSVSEPNQWEQISIVFDLPEQAPDNSKIKIYIWCPGKNKVFMDDVLIEFGK